MDIFPGENRISKIHRLEVVLKTVERCNINCTYCYFFNSSDKSFLKHPKYISNLTIEHIANKLSQGIDELEIEELILIYHGGEPLLQKKDNFDEMCDIFSQKLGTKTKFSLAIQTNALLLDDAWIKLFEKHDVGVGVSIDGPQIYNDRYRIDHRGKGTYERLKEGINLLFSASNQKQISPPGALCVINPEFSAKIIYKHLVHDLGFKNLDFLLPDFTHDSYEPATIELMKKYLEDLFEAWVNDDDPSIKIRILDDVIKKLTRGINKSGKITQVICVSTNGQVVPYDVLRNTAYWSAEMEPSLLHHSLYEVINSELFYSLRTSENSLPRACKDCCWSMICKGGSLINRFSKKMDFDNSSIYCAALRDMYTNASQYLLSNGISFNKIKENLNLSSLEV